MRRIADLGPDENSTRVRVDHWAYGRDLAFERSIGKRADFSATACPMWKAGLSDSETLANIHIVSIFATEYGAGVFPGCTKVQAQHSAM